MTAPAVKRPTPAEVLAEYAVEGRHGYDAWEILCRRAPAKRVTFVLQKLVDDGLMECGVTVQGGWLTEKGRAAL